MPPLFEELVSILDGEITADLETIGGVSVDASPFIVRPQVVVYPKTVKDIGETVLFAKKYKIPLTVRGGGLSGRGATLSEGIIVDMSRYFDKLGQWNIAERTVVLQSGMRFREFLSKANSWKCTLPSVFEEVGDATFGGLFGNGHRDVRMHKVESLLDWVESLRVVLDDGKEYVISPHMTPYGRLREIYDETLTCIKDNAVAIRAGKPDLDVHAMGYDVFGTHISPKTLMSLLFGSQGTLGIITEMTLRLAGEAHQSSGFAIEFTTLDDLSPLLTRGTFANAAYVLLFDRKTLMYQESLGETKLSRHTSAAYVLCAIYEGEETAIKRDVNQAIKATNLPKERITHIMKEEVPLYETLYKKQADALMAYAGNIQTAYRILNDIMLPREHLGNGIRELATLVEEYGLLYSITADCMQGVVRLEVLLDQSKSNLGSTIIELLTGAAEIVKHYRGSLAYKEGDGLMLTPLLPFIYGAPLAETMRSIKNIWDKDHIFNTGKKTTIDFSYLTSHIRHSP